MKAHQMEPPPPRFNPVCLVLETQAEVDALYALLSFMSVQQATGLNGDALSPFASSEKSDYISHLSSLIYAEN